MRKKTLLFFTAVCITLLSAVTPIRNVQAAETPPWPKIGDVIHGFKLSETGYDSGIKADKYLFVHQKTGAKFLALKNSDTNRGFSIKFDTVAENNKGINHILEHSVMSGSKNYPLNDLFFSLYNTTYISYTNAFTYQNFTMYPICSANEAQLLKSADIYLDGVFNPLLLEDENIFKREGFRCDLENKDSALSYNGIVYNEMQGAMSNIERASFHNSMKTLFTNSSQSNNSGGNPWDITTLTYDELMETYNKYYHPSNSIMVLYGDVNYEPFLEMANDNYLSSYSYKEFKVDRGTPPSFTKLQEKTYEFPVAEGSQKENSSVIELIFASKDAKDKGFENFVGLDIAMQMLNLDSSDMKQALLNSNIADSYSIYLDDGIYQPVVHFVAVNANPERKTDFYNLVMEELKNAVTNGFDKEFVKSSLRSFEFQQEIGTTSDTAVNSLIYASIYDNMYNNPMLNYSDAFSSIYSKSDENILENIIEKEILNNPCAALTVTVPKAGLLEKQQAEIEETLSNKKANMSEEEVKALVQKTADYAAWSNREVSQETLDSLQAVTLNEIEIEIKNRDITQTTVGSVNLMSANADVDAVSAVEMDFDLSHLTPEELFYLQFYSEMVETGMATNNRTENQVINETSYKTYRPSMQIGVVMDDKNDTSAHPVFSVEYCGFQDEFTDSLDLVSDTLLNSKVSDISKYSVGTISNIKNRYQYSFSEPIDLGFIRAKAYSSPSYRYVNYLEGLDYYNFVLALEKQLQTNPAEVVEKIEAVRTKAFNKNNLTILLAGNSSAKNKFVASMETLINKLPNVTYQKAEYTLPIPAKRESFTGNLTVQYLVVNAPLLENGIPDSGKNKVIAKVLDNLYLTPEIRLKNGAYGTGSTFKNNNYAAYTYRDSAYSSSLETIDSTHDFLKNLKSDMTPKVLETYKLAAYASATNNDGELRSALQALRNRSNGFTIQDKITSLNEIKETSIEDIAIYAEHLKTLNNNMNYVVFASPSDIEKNKDLFDTIVPLP
ncbi:MAG: insulinase family protein [Lachnospiraceae bacterium]|nr:insulinase family protein [Lachnospiraceae bacterium]